jgi:two-component system, NtrC family, response regulator AtoC
MAAHRKDKLFIVEDDELLSLVLSQGFRKEGYDVVTDAGLGDIPERLARERPDILLLDVSLPGVSGLDILEELRRRENKFPVIMLTADDTAETAVNALKLGAYDYITKPFEIEKLKIIVRNALESVQLKRTIEQYRDDTVSNTLIGKSPVMRHLIEDIKKLAEQRVQNLLVIGESGTGKELVSRAIHNASPAYSNPFVAVNCAALPHGLLESELFGHEKGSFTDAKGLKKGLFEEADGGTLVLDEIGDMDISLQAKLLRVLENRTIRRIGGAKEMPFDVMVIATTNRDLNKLQREGKFRQDLFYRLNMFSLRVAPLRERKEDIPLLAEHFFATSKKEFGREGMQLSPETMEVLINHSWPGNIRELKSLFAKVCLLEKSDIIEPEHIYQRLEVVPAERQTITSLTDSGLHLFDVEKKLIQETLNRAKGNMRKAAKLLNISYDTLRYRMKKFDIR